MFQPAGSRSLGTDADDCSGMVLDTICDGMAAGKFMKVAALCFPSDDFLSRKLQNNWLGISWSKKLATRESRRQGNHGFLGTTA